MAPTSSKNQGLCMVQGTVSSVLCFDVWDSSFLFPFLGKWEQDSESTSRSSSFGSCPPGWKHRRAVCLHTVLCPWPAVFYPRAVLPDVCLPLLPSPQLFFPSPPAGAHVSGCLNPRHCLLPLQGQNTYPEIRGPKYKV